MWKLSNIWQTTPSASARVQVELSNKSNLVLYLDEDIIKKSKALGFNLSRTFENHLKQLITQFSCIKTENAVDSKGEINRKWAEPELNRRPLARKANVITRLDHRPLILYITSVSLIFNFRLYYWLFWVRFPCDISCTIFSILSTGFSRFRISAETSIRFPMCFFA